MAEKATAEAGAYPQLMREVFSEKDGLPHHDVRDVTFDAAGRLWAATRNGVAVYGAAAPRSGKGRGTPRGDGKKWRSYGEKQGLVDPLSLGDMELIAIAAVGRTIWVATPHRLYRLEGQKFRQVTGGPRGLILTMRACEGALLVATDTELGIFGAASPKRKSLARRGARKPARAAARWTRVRYPQAFTVNDVLLDPDGMLWAATDAGLWLWDGSTWAAQEPGRRRPGPPARDMSSLALDGAGMLWVGTMEGIGLFDRHGFWSQIQGKDGLPYEKVSCITAGEDGAVWAGFYIGCARLREAEWDYFANMRWLPNDEVRALAVGADGSAWVATAAGIARIYEQKMTLEQKAAHFEDRIQKRHYRMGFVADCGLEAPGDLESFTYEASDNDGLWTALYVAAECFRYAATKDPEARERARTSVYAMMELERLTTIPGFPARALVRKGEKNVRKSGGEWHDSEDGKWEWKADTSSDEIDGHFYAYALYYDLVAGDRERRDLEGVCRRIMDHIIDHGYLLVDLDGEHTMWGVWSPEMLNGPWEAQRGLNSLEILSYLKTTYHVTGDEKYQEHYLELVHDHHYALNTLYQKITYPGSVNHSDDELAIIAYDPLLRYETDPALRAIYLASMERTWQIERPEHSPFQNYIYGWITGKFCDVEESLKSLRDIPWDTIQWRVRNSHRTDLAEDARMGRFSERQAMTVIKPHERAMLKWNGNPYRLDDGGGGRGEDDGAFFLLPYWMGRYCGYVKE